MTSQSKVILLYISLFLQSCSSVLLNKSNIIPITRENLLTNGLLERPMDGNRRMTVLEENQPLIHELRSKLGRLRNEGFLDGDDPDHIDMRKHLMFVFYHWLVCKQERMPIEDRVRYFERQPDYPNLLWVLFETRENTVEFRLRSLYNRMNDPRHMENLRRARQGRAPFVNFDGGREKIHIDHLVRDNNVTIELPEALHKDKTLFIDNLTNIPKKKVTRNSVIYWSRFRNGRN